MEYPKTLLVHVHEYEGQTEIEPRDIIASPTTDDLQVEVVEHYGKLLIGVYEFKEMRVLEAEFSSKEISAEGIEQLIAEKQALAEKRAAE